MKITIHNGLKGDGLEREVIIDNKSWDTISYDAVELCVAALTTIGYDKDNILEAMKELIENAGYENK